MIKLSSKNIKTEEMKKLHFGKQAIKLEIPKFTECLIVTTISRGTDGSTNVITNSYTSDEIEEFIKGGDSD